MTHSLVERARNIRAPIEIDQQAQDPANGPRGGYVLWEAVPETVPKRLVLANSTHNPYRNNPHVVDRTKGAWLDCWLLQEGQDCGRVNSSLHRVLTYFERRTGEGNNEVVEGAPHYSSDWPLPETSWERYYLRADGAMNASTSGGDGEVAYASTPASRHVSGNRQVPPRPFNIPTATFADAPDQARWSLGFQEPTAIDGPINLTLWAKSSATDTDLSPRARRAARSTGPSTRSSSPSRSFPAARTASTSRSTRSVMSSAQAMSSSCRSTRLPPATRSRPPTPTPPDGRQR